MTPFHEQFSKILDILNVSGNSVAKNLGAHQGLVNRYRNGSTSPPVEFAQKFCEHYGISANWLLLDIEPIMLSDITVAAGTSKAPKNLVNKKEFKADLNSIMELFEKMQKKYDI